MKFSILALGAAVAGISTQCAAQLHIESSFPTRAPEARLVSQQDDVGSALIDEPIDNSADMPYFAPNPPQAEISADRLNQAQSTLNESSPEPATPDENSIAGKPVKKIASGAPLHVLEMTPEVGMVPVCWQNTGGCPTPNPVANYMTQSWCSNGLWDGYACQRARQCAHIQQQLFGHNRYTCNGCAACGTARHIGHAAANNGCSTCAPAASHCAQAAPAKPAQVGLPPAQTLMTSAPAVQSPLIGELQAGLPVVDFSQVAQGTVPPTGYGQPAAQLTTAPASDRLPNGQPLLQLPSDTPTVPKNADIPDMPSLPSIMPAFPMPASPMPAATPVVASRPSASLR